MYVSSDQKDWDEHLQSILLAYRVSPSEVTGDSPFFLLYGREPRLPMDVSLLPPKDLSPSIAEHRARVVQHLEEVQEIARANIQRAQQRMKLLYDQQSNSPEYDLGQQVWLYTPKSKKGLSKKLRHNWHGPMRICKKLSPVSYKVRAPSNSRIATTVHVNRMKLYYDPNDRPILPPDEGDSSQPYLQESEIPDDSFEDTSDNDALAQPASSTSGSKATPMDCSSSSPDIVSDQTAIPSDSAIPLAAPATSSDNGSTDIYQVERILKERIRKGKRQYYIKWLGFSSRHNT